MSLIDVNPSEAKDLVAVPAGEHLLSIISAECVPTSKDPNKMQIAVIYRIEGEPTALPVRDWLGIPHQTDDERTRNAKLLKLRSFCESFDYDFASGIETEELPGRQGKAILKIENSEDYGDQNKIGRYVV